MIAQDDHGRVSGGFANAWREDLFLGKDRREDVEYAVSEHDRSWLAMDDTPIWNDELGEPYSFMDYPLSLRIVFYKKGIDETTCQNPYAGLLCSLHYTHLMEGNDDEAVKSFVHEETERQQKLMSEFNLSGKQSQDMIKEHRKLLGFCDNLSLFICMNEPMTALENTGWFAKGFNERFNFFDNEKIVPNWLKRERVTLSHFPFSDHLTVQLPLRKVKKELIKEIGIAKAYRMTPIKSRTVTFTRED